MRECTELVHFEPFTGNSQHTKNEKCTPVCVFLKAMVYLKTSRKCHLNLCSVLLNIHIPEVLRRLLHYDHKFHSILSDTPAESSVEL